MKSIVSGIKGDVLEAVCTPWLIARLVAARRNGQMTISADELLCLSGNNKVIIPDFATPNILKRFVISENRLPKISSDVKEFANQFNENVEVSEMSPCRIHISAKGQQYDLMLVSLVKGKPFVLFIDFKSKKILKPDEVKSSCKEFKADMLQFQRVKSVIEELREFKERSPVSQALVDGNYAFVYATTHPVVNNEDKDPRVYVANEEETTEFMSIIKPFYRSSRLTADIP